MTIDQAGDALIEMIERTAKGRFTAAEAVGHREFSMTKLYRSAEVGNPDEHLATAAHRAIIARSPPVTRQRRPSKAA